MFSRTERSLSLLARTSERKKITLDVQNSPQQSRSHNSGATDLIFTCRFSEVASLNLASFTVVFQPSYDYNAGLHRSR